jgi:hypothetical protein
MIRLTDKKILAFYKYLLINNAIPKKTAITPAKIYPKILDIHALSHSNKSRLTNAALYDISKNKNIIIHNMNSFCMIASAKGYITKYTENGKENMSI